MIGHAGFPDEGLQKRAACDMIGNYGPAWCSIREKKGDDFEVLVLVDKGTL